MIQRRFLIGLLGLLVAGHASPAGAQGVASRVGVQGDISCAGNLGVPTLISDKTSSRVFIVLSNKQAIDIAVLETFGAAPAGPLTSTNSFIVGASGGVLNLQSYGALYCQSTDASARALNVKEGLR